MKYWNKICGISVIFFLSSYLSIAQNIENKVNIPSKNNQTLVSLQKSPSIRGIFDKTGLTPPWKLSILPGNYYTQHFGFFCKKELALEKVTKVPFRFRLGSIQQCDRMEGKIR